MGTGKSADNAARLLEDRFAAAREDDAIDERMGFQRLEQGETRQGWMVNMHPTLLPDETHPTGRSGVDYYFVQDDASMFKVTVLYQPYFLLACYAGTEFIVEEWLRRKFEGVLSSVERKRKEDLKLPNHLVGNQRTVLQLQFMNVNDLLTVRKELLPLAQEAQKKVSAIDAYTHVLQDTLGSTESDMHMSITNEETITDSSTKVGGKNPEDCVVCLYEYDVPYYLRVAIDNDIRVGLWYDVSFHEGVVALRAVPERVKRADPVVMAFDIETTKQPLKFPDAETDVIMMISYMIDGQGFLITNREIISEDIEDFEYTPKDEYEGPFIIFNEPNEVALLRRFFSHIQEARPTVMATYNGDSFDFMFVDTRARIHGMDMRQEIGFSKDSDDEYKSRHCSHLDCFRWVKRDSYLPQGSQGLKAVTIAKLGYDPMELDPELMTPYASEQPQTLAQYSVSDAVATYYLYMKYVHPFIFSLCNIIPLNPDEVLRKGSGTLCETLLMVQAYKSNILMPNRHVDPIDNTFEGHILESETYVGGHVEALEAGVFRSDIPTDFHIEPAAIQQLMDDLDHSLKFSIEKEGHMSMDDVENYEQVRSQIYSMLELLRDNPVRQDKPLIYHLDVAAMYPNIMLSNRLQPDSVVDEAMCASCDYNRPGMSCDRRMKWAWRGEYFPAKRDEINMIRHALDMESFAGRDGQTMRSYQDLSPSEQSALLQKRLADYSRKVYKRVHDTKTVIREAIICQRENPFYINTVRDFRDRRYEYKGLHKKWKKNLDKAAESGSLDDVLEAKKMIVLYDSLQLAHKCILNSFYGYVMRKGARWYSMEMAGITCLTGATIIQMAKELVDRIGRPLELDTDGIWCMLPGTFPENFNFRCRNGKSFGVSYPCTMLNYLVHERFTNHQYHDLVDPQTGHYQVHSENSIFFELDGPYRAMILPSSKEEDKLLKKRYAVFNDDGSLAELKGFEVKRRGELQLIKDFQKQIFSKFLLGDSLVSCYAAVAQVADQWLDVLYSKGSTLHDEELIELIAENKSMTKLLNEYGSQKSTAITTARRLAEILGNQVVKDRGLACKFIVSAKPYGAPVTERAVPVAIFNAEPDIKAHFLRRFLKDSSLNDFDLRSILDWNYYIDRFAGVIQKLITIPAAMQKVRNPVPRVRHPDWLMKRVAARDDKVSQVKLDQLFRGDAVKARTLPPPPPAKPRVVEEPALPADPPLPPIEQDYPGWVSAMRVRWRRRRAERRGLEKRHATLGGFFEQRSSAMASATWDIVQLAPTPRPGEYRLWVLVDRQLHALKLHVPRQFYVNFVQLPQPGILRDTYRAEAVARVLPRGMPQKHLMHITVSEEEFRRDDAHFSALLNHPNVDGVYEMRVPLDVRALIQLGASCKLRPGAKLSHAVDAGLALEDLSHASHAHATYLRGGRAMRTLYLYHACDKKRHVMVLVNSDGQVYVHLVDSAGLKEWPSLEVLYRERLQAMRDSGRIREEECAFEYPAALDSTVHIHTSEAKAFRALAKDVREARTGRPGAPLLALCSSRPLSYYDERMSLSSDMPVLMVPAALAEDALPALGWQTYAARRMVNCYLRTSMWLTRWVELAAHLDVPLGNMPRDFAMFGSDLDLARRLQQSDMVLWWSDSPRPDLGGREDDMNPGTVDELDMLEITNPGAYASVCLEVQVADLALNCVLQNASVHAMEGIGAASMAFDSASHLIEEYTQGRVPAAADLGDAVLTSQTFAAVRSMVKAWHVEKTRGLSTCASLLADNFWRWACSSQSALFEPALQRFLQRLMRKTLLQLLAEFRRLGVQIVYASYTRLLLLTNRPTAASAAAFGRYLMSTATAPDVFRHLSLTIVHVWEYLVFLDMTNVGGVMAHDHEAAELAEDVDVEMAWNIQSFLPPAVQERFAKMVGLFIYELYQAKRQSVAKQHERPIMRPLPQNVPPQTSDAQAKESTSIDNAKHIVAHEMTPRLLRMVSEMQEEWKAQSNPDEWAFPQLPGSHLPLTNPTLEFVKAVTRVLALHKEAVLEAQICKRNLLDLIGVREFAPAAEWRNPCLSFRLPWVICHFCNDDRTLDLCRDADLIASAPQKEWHCLRCHTLYDRDSIELRLIAMVQQQIAQHATQDLHCSRCGRINTHNLAPYCTCSGAWVQKNTQSDTNKRLAHALAIAQFHAFPLLASTVEMWLAAV
ncbi:DNA-directed DNA polymerase [Malassezia nana]|uniref:DNA polymerase epsilon catalytic subunit n=1 Tax=Malassezia nana TaxID=180528 RepID=A0AAF0EMB5_9BASI|nr:DNA-directed DNA polymerase [Malassezia nana]